MKRGKIISCEGIDGCGKGTNTKKIVKYLESKGLNVKLYSFPQYETPIGKIIARYLQGEFGNINQVPYELICMAYAADRASIQKELNELLEQGYYVVMDRYTYSNLFTAAKMEREKWESFIKWIETIEFENLGIASPDYNFYLYVDPKISIEKIEQRGKREYQEGKEDIHENNKQLLIDTAECYLSHAKSCDNWFIINQMKDGNQLSIEEVFEQIKINLDKIIEN